MNDYIMLETSGGAYAVSPALVKRVAFQSAYYRHRNQYKRRVSSRDGWGLPETYHYEFDFPAAKAAGRAAADGMMARLLELVGDVQISHVEGMSPLGLEDRIESFRRELIGLEMGMRDDKAQIDRALKHASHDSMRNIDRAVRGWGIAAQAATITRDVSADVFLVCAAALSGGAAIAGLGIGSVGKGAFKYQDTENVGAAILEGTTSFVTGVIPVPGAQAGRAQQYAMVFARGQIQATGSYATALVEGKDPLEAAVSVGVSMTAGAVAGRAVRRLEVKDLGAVKGMLGDTTLPVSIRTKFNVSGGAVARVVAANTATETAKKVATSGAERLIREVRNQAARPMDVRLPIADPFLGELAIMGPDMCELPRGYL